MGQRRALRPVHLDRELRPPPTSVAHAPASPLACKFTWICLLPLIVRDQTSSDAQAATHDRRRPAGGRNPSIGGGTGPLCQRSAPVRPVRRLPPRASRHLGPRQHVPPLRQGRRRGISSLPAPTGARVRRSRAAPSGKPVELDRVAGEDLVQLAGQHADRGLADLLPRVTATRCRGAGSRSTTSCSQPRSVELRRRSGIDC
jgi:hypothetical protein